MRADRPVLVVGPARRNSGFGRVTAGLLRSLSGHVEVHHLAPDRTSDDPSRPWPIYGTGQRADPFAEARLTELVRRLQPLVLVVQDLTRLARTVSPLRSLQSPGGRMPVVAYCALDGDLSGTSAALPVGSAALARLVVFTHASKRRILDAYSRTRSSGVSPAATCPPIDIIGHGVDDHPFALLLDVAQSRSASIAEARRRLGWTIPPDAYVVLNASRNQARKRLDLTLRAFAIAASQIPQAYLWLHTENRTVVGRDLVAQAGDLGIGDRLLFPHRHSPCGHDASDEALNLLYNACDVGLNTSLGESWGLSAFEHALTGAPQAMTHTTVSEELWSGAATLIPGTPTPLGATLIGTQANIEAAAAALIALHENPARRDKRGRHALARASSHELTWEACGHQWRDLLDDVLHAPTLAWSR